MATLFKLPNRADYHAKIRIGPYRQRKARLCADEQVSRTWHALLQTAVDRKAAGEPIRPEARAILPRRLLEAFGLVSELANKRRATYAQNVADYVGELRTAGRDAKYVYNADATLTALGVAAKWSALSDVSREGLTAFLATKKAAGSSARTLKNVRATAVSFARWACDAKRLDVNLLQSIPLPDIRMDRRRLRRALTPSEMSRLLAVAGPRELCYRVAASTGLRLRELRQLEWRDIRLDDSKPRIELRPEATKNRKGGTIPLPDGVARRLAALMAESGRSTGRVFATIPAFDTWVSDLNRAGLAAYDADGVLRLGFHSLRTTFASELERAGVSPRTICELMRHSDYRLTATIYTDRAVLDPFGAAAKLPEYAASPPNPEPIRRFGTNDAPAAVDAVATPETWDQKWDQKGGAKRHLTARNGAIAGSAKGAKTPENQGKTLVLQSSGKAPRVGLEPTHAPADSPENKGVSDKRPNDGTKCGTKTAHDSGAVAPDSGLAIVAAAWPDLSPSLRNAVLAIVAAAGRG